MTYQIGPVDPEDRAQYSRAPARRRTLTAAALAICVMALFAAAVWFAYIAGSHRPASGGVPLIRAEERPAKVKPASPAGMHIPDRNMLIYNESQPKVERLLPAAEQPLPRPAPPVPAAAPASAAAPPAPAATPAEPAPAAATPPTSNAAVAGLRVQLGALRSAALAEREWQRLKRANSDILGKLSASPVRADLGGKGIFYRIEVGPLATTQAASRLCGELKKRKIGCILVR